MEKHDKANYAGRHGKILISENIESEFKVGLFFQSELTGVGEVAAGGERRIMAVGAEIWDAYLAHRYAFEDRQKLSKPQIPLADGDFISSHRPEQKKEHRVRSFFTLAHGHPHDLEIRTEIRDGRKITMLKKGRAATPDNPVILREELKLTCDPRERTEDVLAQLPALYKKQLSLEFNKNSAARELLRSNSHRAKTKVRLRTDTVHGPLVFANELAFDQGSGVTALGDRWPIREFEGEVKGVYRPGVKIDLKDNPKLIGLDHDQMARLCADALRLEREDYMEFAQLYLLQRARSEPQRYGDIDVAGIYVSKSLPGQRLLKASLAQAGRTCADITGFPSQENAAVLKRAM